MDDVEPGFELFDHTADIGIRCRAASMVDLIPAATAGLYAVIGDLKLDEAIGPYDWNHAGDDAALLLRDYLAELLLQFECRHAAVVDVHITDFTRRRLTVNGNLRSINMETSDFYREVKAITYHELGVREVEGGFEATVIVDI